MEKLICSLDEFIVVDGKSIEKNADCFGGYYLSEEIPNGNKYELVSSDTIDAVGVFRAAAQKDHYIFASKDALVKYLSERPNPFL